MRNGAIALALLAALLAGAAVDAARPPGQQISARAYLVCVAGYRAALHPVTSHFIRCRYRPTCSNYSALAVQRFGIARGLRLTLSRLLSCRQSVAPGTLDPVPSR